MKEKTRNQFAPSLPLHEDLYPLASTEYSFLFSFFFYKRNHLHRIRTGRQKVAKKRHVDSTTKDSGNGSRLGMRKKKEKKIAGKLLDKNRKLANAKVAGRRGWIW